ncbi:MAG: protein kinase [Myxococcales bacterium]|nr:protein kinase [Myxococcales bacterium]
MNCAVCSQANPDGARFCQSCGAPVARPSEDPSSLIGQVVGGRYLVTRVIGEGGMGVVYEAEQKMGAHTRKVAIKTLLPTLSRDHTVVSRFYRECGVVAQLEHPNTIRLYDFGETPDQRLYIAMEFVNGEPLTALIARGPIPIARAQHILKQVGGALAEAHALGIVHRDLKPDNIVLTRRAGEDDFVKVLDFGIAKTTGKTDKETKLTQQGIVLGTPPYMSPEQLAGKELDLRSDVYSLGIIAYEMVTGRLPFEGETPWQWATQHMTVPAPPMRSRTTVPISDSFERGVQHALCKAPVERPSTMLEFIAELTGEPPRRVNTAPDLAPGVHTSPMAGPPEVVRGQTQLGGAPPLVPAYRTDVAVAAPIPPPPPPRQHRRSSPWGWVLGTLGLLFGGAFAAVAAWQYSQSSEPAPDLPPLGSTGADGGPVVVQPLSPTNEPPPVVPLPPTEPTRTTTKPPTKPPPSSTGPLPPPPPASSPPPPPPPPPASTAPPPPPPPSGPQGDAACAASSQAASSWNIEGAVALYRQCEKTGGTPSGLGNARTRIRLSSPKAVRDRAFLGNCKGAKSAADAASSVGEGGPAQAEYAKSSCAGK